jgi:hypothetical protein
MQGWLFKKKKIMLGFLQYSLEEIFVWKILVFFFFFFFWQIGNWVTWNQKPNGAPQQKTSKKKNGI